VLAVEKRVRNRERHLVPHLGRADGVGGDEDVGHGADPIVRCVAIFGPEDAARVRELLDELERPVELLVAFGPEETPLPGARDVDFGAETERVVAGIAELSERLSYRVEEQPRGFERYPAVAVLPEGRDVG